ncbi:hypothetical protein COP2_019735 [Malus domestica]
MSFTPNSEFVNVTFPTLLDLRSPIALVAQCVYLPSGFGLTTPPLASRVMHESFGVNVGFHLVSNFNMYNLKFKW